MDEKNNLVHIISGKCLTHFKAWYFANQCMHDFSEPEYEPERKESWINLIDAPASMQRGCIEDFFEYKSWHLNTAPLHLNNSYDIYIDDISYPYPSVFLTHINIDKPTRTAVFKFLLMEANELYNKLEAKA